MSSARVHLYLRLQRPSQLASLQGRELGVGVVGPPEIEDHDDLAQARIEEWLQGSCVQRLVRASY